MEVCKILSIPRYCF